MGLKIILGPKSQAKSKYIYELISKDTKNIRDVLLFVPSQRRVVEENEYMEYLNLSGILNLKITTISEYIKKMISITNTHASDKYLNDIDKKVLISKLAKENSYAFKKYSKVSNKRGFILEIENYVETFRNFDLENVDILNVVNDLELDDVLKQKLVEILSVYNAYLDEIKNNGFIDDTSYIKLYTSIVDEFPGKVYFDGYNNFKEVEYEIIEMYLKSGVDVIVSITTDAKNLSSIDAGMTSEIFNISNDTYKKLIKISSKHNIEVEEQYIEYSENKPNDLQSLAIDTFSFDIAKSKINAENIKLTLVNNEKSEIYQVAEKIIDSLKAGDKFSDNIICTTDISKYENILKKIFLEYQIPYYLDKNEDIINNIFVRYFINFINLINKKDSKAMLKLLKLGLNNIEKEDILLFENYALEFNATNLNKKFIYNSKNTYDLDKINKIREDMLKLFDFSDFLRDSKNVKYYITYIYEKIQKMDIIKNYIDIIESEVEDVNKKDLFVQAMLKTNEAIDSIYKIYRDSEITFGDFVNLVQMVLESQSVNTIPEKQNQALVIDINKSKSISKKHVYVLGANEEEFPIIPREDFIFSDDELESVEASFIKLKEGSESKYNMGLYNIYEIFNIPTEDINIYIKSSNIQGKTLNRSRVIDNILEKFNLHIEGKVLQDDYNFPTKENLLVRLNEEENALTKISIYEYFKKHPTFFDVVSWRKNDDNLKKETLDMLYNKKMLSSVSKLENFKKCPFSYCMKYLLNIRKREKFDLSSIDLGTFMHEVIEEFSIYLFTNNIMWGALVDNTEFKKIEIKIDEIINSKIDKILQKQKESVRYNILKLRLISTIKTMIRMIAKSFSQSEFVPYGYEIEFRDGAMFAPITIKIGERQIELIGKIDRVDVLKTSHGMYARVVDYKSSNKNLDIDSIKEGISVQLLTYLSAFIENKSVEEKQNVIPAAMTYFTISDKLINLDKITSEDEIKQSVLEGFRLKGIFLNDIEILNKMDNKFETKDRLLDISKMGISKGTKKALEKEEFIKLCDDAKVILKNILEEILSGVVSISPNKKTEACKFCEYGDICRKNIKV